MLKSNRTCMGYAFLLTGNYKVTSNLEFLHQVPGHVAA